MSSAMMKTTLGRRRVCAAPRWAATRDMEARAATRSIGRREMFGDMAGSLHAVAGDGGIIPFNAGAGAIGDDGVAVADFDWVFEDGRRPVDIFEPVARRRHREQVCAEFGIEVRRHGHPRALRERGGFEPPADAADAR